MTVRFELQVGKRMSASLDVFDVSGRRIRRLLDESEIEPKTVVSWNGSSDGGQRVASGVYWYRFRWGGGIQTGRLVLTR